MEELRLHWQRRLLCKTKHPAHWLVNVPEAKDYVPSATYSFWREVNGHDWAWPSNTHTSTTEVGQQCCNLFECAAPSAPKPRPDVSQPDGALHRHSLTIKSYNNYKKALYTRSSAQKTLQLRFDNCHQYTEVSSASMSGNGASVGRRHSLYPSDLAAVICKNALCCQKFSSLKSKGTPSSGTRHLPTRSAEPGSIFRQPCSSFT